MVSFLKYNVLPLCSALTLLPKLSFVELPLVIHALGAVDGQGQNQAEQDKELQRLEPCRAMPDNGSRNGSGSAGLVQFSCLTVNLPQPPHAADE